MKNSAGVKFNDATELIIEADIDGTVTSCRNLSNNTEYVGGGGGNTAALTFSTSYPQGGLSYVITSSNTDPENTVIMNSGYEYETGTTTISLSLNNQYYYILNDGEHAIEGNYESVELWGYPAWLIKGDCTITVTV